ncbi:MAG: hypothetical protein KGL72_03700 [Actinomycetales bacterium]|nr:hypothetical protein [Actinomycetales bacterium]
MSTPPTTSIGASNPQIRNSSATLPLSLSGFIERLRLLNNAYSPKCEHWALQRYRDQGCRALFQRHLTGLEISHANAGQVCQHPLGLYPSQLFCAVSRTGHRCRFCGRIVGNRVEVGGITNLSRHQRHKHPGNPESQELNRRATGIGGSFRTRQLCSLPGQIPN